MTSSACGLLGQILSCSALGTNGEYGMQISGMLTRGIWLSGRMIKLLRMFSRDSMVFTMTVSTSSFTMSPAEHLVTSESRLSIQAGLSSISTWHTHATGLRQT